jgi:hypothetical protein
MMGPYSGNISAILELPVLFVVTMLPQRGHEQAFARLFVVSSSDVFRSQADGGRRVRLSFVGADKKQLWNRHPSSEELRRRDVNGVESSKWMRCDERFCSRENVSRDFNQCPVRTIRRDALQDFWDSCGVERSFRDTPSQRASKLDRHQN